MEVVLIIDTHWVKLVEALEVLGLIFLEHGCKLKILLPSNLVGAQESLFGELWLNSSSLSSLFPNLARIASISNGSVSGCSRGPKSG